MNSGTIGGRIGMLIQKLGIKKVEFATALKIDQSYVTQLVNGRRNPSERLIDDICREYKVNENWLRTGEGEMFVSPSADDEISDLIGKLLFNETPSFKKRLIVALSRLDERDWEALEKLVQNLKDDPA